MVTAALTPFHRVPFISFFRFAAHRLIYTLFYLFVCVARFIVVLRLPHFYAVSPPLCLIRFCVPPPGTRLAVPPLRLRTTALITALPDRFCCVDFTATHLHTFSSRCVARSACRSTCYVDSPLLRSSVVVLAIVRCSPPCCWSVLDCYRRYFLSCDCDSRPLPEFCYFAVYRYVTQRAFYNVLPYLPHVTCRVYLRSPRFSRCSAAVTAFTTIRFTLTRSLR